MIMEARSEYIPNYTASHALKWAFIAFSLSSPAGRTTRIIDPDGDEDGRRYESSNTLPDLTSRMHEAKSSPGANREQMLRIRRSNIQLGDGRIKVMHAQFA